MLHSETITDLATALAKTQATIGKAVKDSANDAFKRNGKASKYADLTAVWDAWQAVGPFNDLSVVQAPGPMIDNRMSLTTMLMHKSGQWIQETLTIPLTKVDAQGYGSATTYARRYALAAMVGIAPEDDDGNAASIVANGNASNGEKVSQEQLHRLQDRSTEVSADLLGFCKYMGVRSLKEIAASDFTRAMDALEAKRRKVAPKIEEKAAA